MKEILYILIFVFYVTSVSAQEGWEYKGTFNFGCNFTLNYNKGSTSFPGLRFYCGLGINGVYNKHLIVNYGPTVSLYTKSIGANLNPLVSDIQLDFVNSISFGAGWNDLIYNKIFRTLDNGSYYNIITNKDYAILLTSNFIINNHKRNQVVGSISLSFPKFTINYFNDGGAPFYWLPIADNLDRYWTGGISLFVHDKVNYNSFEISFDQFTGYGPLLFEACSMLGIYLPNYNLQYDESTHDPKPANYNTSMYNIKIFPMRNYGINIGTMGALKLTSFKKKKELFFGLQDIIHIRGFFPLHPNNDNEHIFIGGLYNNFNDVKL